MHTLTLRAPAKINLSLRVLAPRDDGFHDLETLFQAVGLHDTLEIAPAATPGIELVVEGAELGPPHRNLVWKGATAFLQWSGMEGFGARIRLVKRIPAGAGLGGGSSDAAAALKGMSVLFGHPLGPERLLQLAAALGSDVPFFMGDTGLALGRGRGEILTPMAPLPEAWVVLAMPAVELATGEMFGDLAAAREGAGAAAPGPVLSAAGPSGWAEVASVAVNDFQGLARERSPQVAAALDALAGSGSPLLALLSGSGAAAFALHGDRGGAEAAAAEASSIAPDVAFDVVPTLAELPPAGGGTARA